jgi:hypothetical protein
MTGQRRPGICGKKSNSGMGRRSCFGCGGWVRCLDVFFWLCWEEKKIYFPMIGSACAWRARAIAALLLRLKNKAPVATQSLPRTTTIPASTPFFIPIALFFTARQCQKLMVASHTVLLASSWSASLILGHYSTVQLCLSGSVSLNELP